MDSLISKNDKSVLQMILNPNLPFTEEEDNIDSVEGTYIGCLFPGDNVIN